MAQRHCASAGVSPRRRKMSLKSTSSGWMGKGSSPLTLVTAGSIRSQVTKREIYWRRLSLPWGCGGSPPGVCVWYMRSLRKDTFSWHMVRSYLNHANRRAHTGSNKPRQQRTSEIIYIWLWYAVCGERACVGINFFFFFFQTNSKMCFHSPEIDSQVMGLGQTRKDWEVEEKPCRGCQWAPRWIGSSRSLTVVCLELLVVIISVNEQRLCYFGYL